MVNTPDETVNLELDEETPVTLRGLFPVLYTVRFWVDDDPVKEGKLNPDKLMILVLALT